MNILFTSAGRRGYLVSYFKEELAGKGLVHAANSESITPAFLEADRTVITPLIYNHNYIDFLLNYCKENNIDALIPLFDIDIPVLTKNEKSFNEIGVTLVAGPSHVAEMCNDKWKTYQFVIENGFNAPYTCLGYESAANALATNKLSYPVLIKPRWGMGSIGLYTADNEDELRVLFNKVKKDIETSYLKYESTESIEESVIVQQVLTGDEYGWDVVNDLNGEYITTFVKRKLAMRAGETDIAVTAMNESMEQTGKKLSKLLGHYANLDVDVFLDGERITILEMNARFGGGYPFTHMGGVNLPRAIINWIEGKKADPSCFVIRSNVTGVKTVSLSEWHT